ELDAVGPEAVREPDRERLRHGEAPRAKAPDRAQGELSDDLAPAQARLDQLVDAEVLPHVHLEQAELADPRRLHRVREDVALAVGLRVEERIGYPERHRVPHISGAEGVAVDENRVGQAGPILSTARRFLWRLSS